MKGRNLNKAINLIAPLVPHQCHDLEAAGRADQSVRAHRIWQQCTSSGLLSCSTRGLSSHRTPISLSAHQIPCSSFKAAAAGHVQVVLHLVRAGGLQLLTAPNASGDTPLALAVRNNHVSVQALLVAQAIALVVKP